ncbi:MAG: DUF2380 domain-containing protein [Candidatus Neomarinimicrobiota bacterium]
MRGNKVNHPKLRPIVFIVAVLASLAAAQTNVAIIPLDAKGVSDIEASVLTDRLAFELFKTGLFTVLERGKMEEILTEQNFQLTGCVTEECLVEVGQLLGVEQMLAGSVSKIGNTYSVILRLIDAQSGAIVQVAGYDHRGSIDELLSRGMGVVARDIAGEPVEPAEPVAPVTVEPEATATKQGRIYVLPRVAVGFAELGRELVIGGQFGYGHESWGKLYVDFLLGWSHSFNIVAVYEPGFRPLYWQFGVGLVGSSFYREDWGEDDYVEGFGIRVGVGYNYTLGKYLLIRPALEFNLGPDSHQNNYAISLNFGIQTGNLW